MGGAPTYERDYELLLALGITAVVDLRAERTADAGFFEAHGIAFRQYRVPDVTVPAPEVLTDAVAWIDEQLADGRTVLVHCAKGRGRSATVVAAYLMRERDMTFDEANDLLQSKRAARQARDPAPPRARVVDRRGSGRRGRPALASRGSPKRSCRRSARVPGHPGDGGSLTVDWRDIVALG